MSGVSDIVHYQMDACIAAALIVMPASAVKPQLDQLEALVNELRLLLIGLTLGGPEGPAGPPIYPAHLVIQDSFLI